MKIIFGKTILKFFTRKLIPTRCVFFKIFFFFSSSSPNITRLAQRVLLFIIIVPSYRRAVYPRPRGHTGYCIAIKISHIPCITYILQWVFCILCRGSLLHHLSTARADQILRADAIIHSDDFHRARDRAWIVISFFFWRQVHICRQFPRYGDFSEDGKFYSTAKKKKNVRFITFRFFFSFNPFKIFVT